MKELEYPFHFSTIIQSKRRLKRELQNQSNLLEVKIAILSGSTIGEIKHILELFLLNHQIKPIFWEGQYNRFYEDIMFPNNELINFGPDLIYIHTTIKNINFLQFNEEYFSYLMGTYKKFEGIWNNIKKLYCCPIIQNNFEMLPYRIMGNSSIFKDDGNLNFIRLLNDKLYEYAKSVENFFIQDINYLSAWYGLERWFDSKDWYTYKYAFHIEAIPYMCHNLANIVKSIYGKNKKALILDLDNTLWGGVIGDEGMEGIQIGNETPIGMIFMEFQQYIKQLSKMGIILNVCSKNDEKTAINGLNHPGSILKREDFITFKANWIDKHENVKDIVKKLNISENSVVFIDDNPVERNIVKSFIPDIEVLEMDKPERFLTALDYAGYFELTLTSKEDKERNEFYKGNIERENIKSEFESYNEYLLNLEMECFVEKINQSNLKRVTQLINKTNQFNFTTIRYTENQIEDIYNDSSYLTITLSLKDKFGDNGLVSVLIASIKEETASIDLWVMSCRVFKRNLEYVMFDELVLECKKKKIKNIHGLYRKTNKNQVLENFYKDFNFKLSSSSESESVWCYQIPDSYKMKNEVMEVNKCD